MSRIVAGTLVEEVISRYPAAKVVLSRYPSMRRASG